MGTIVTVPGIIIVPRYTPKSRPEPLKGIFANTKAAIDAESTATSVQLADRKKLLYVARPKEKPCIWNTRR